MGQLHLELYGLIEVADREGVVLLAEIVAVEGSTVDVRVVQRWPASPPANTLFSNDDPSGLRAGERATIGLYEGVVWEDEFESPLDERLADALSPGEVNAGDTVLGVVAGHGTELLAADTSNMEIVGVAFDPAKRRRYCDETSIEQLHRHLIHPHLGGLARHALESRGGVQAGTLVEVIPEESFRSLLSDIFFRYEDGQRALLIVELNKTDVSGPRLVSICDTVTSYVPQLAPENRGPAWLALGSLAARLNIDEQDERNQIYSMIFHLDRGIERGELGGPLDPYVGTLLRYDLDRSSDTDSDRRQLVARMGQLSAGARTLYLAGLCHMLGAGKRAKRYGERTVDHELFRAICETIELYPNADELDALARLTEVLRPEPSAPAQVWLETGDPTSDHSKSHWSADQFLVMAAAALAGAAPANRAEIWSAVRSVARMELLDATGLKLLTTAPSS